MPLGGVGQLVGLLDGVRDDRSLVLFAVPRTFAPQTAGELVQAPERLGDLRPVGAHGRGVSPSQPEVLVVLLGVVAAAVDVVELPVAVLVVLGAL